MTFTRKNILLKMILMMDEQIKLTKISRLQRNPVLSRLWS
jgi:hypothetical protein